MKASENFIILRFNIRQSAVRLAAPPISDPLRIVQTPAPVLRVLRVLCVLNVLFPYEDVEDGDRGRLFGLTHDPPLTFQVRIKYGTFFNITGRDFKQRLLDCAGCLGR